MGPVRENPWRLAEFLTEPLDRGLDAEVVTTTDEQPAAGFEHVFIPLDNVDPERAAEFDEHTAASYAGGARLQYSSGAWDQADPADIALEGGCFEVARCYYYDRLPRDMGATTDETSDIIIERFPTQRPNGVRDWVAWLDGPGRQDGIDWRDRFYLDQRCGGWLSAGLQGFDISGRRQVFLGNDHGLLADLLSADVASRRTSAPQAEIVARLAPALADMPFNPGSGKSTRSSGASAPKQDKMTGLGARLRGLSRKRPAR
jgi:hypothetical protein